MKEKEKDGRENKKENQEYTVVKERKWIRSKKEDNKEKQKSKDKSKEEKAKVKKNKKQK